MLRFVSLNPAALPPPATFPAAFPVAGHLTAHLAGDPLRAEVERCIRHTYAQHYGALVPAFAPVLLALRESGQVLAAAGYRSAGDGPLFLESYLDAPVDCLIAAQTGQPVARARIVEVGHLAAPHGGEGRRLIQLLGPLLVHEGFDWVVSTVTQELQLMLARLGLATLVLGPARADALGDQTQYWGSYYSHAPVVLAIHLRSSLRQFLARRAPARAGEAA